MNELYNPFTDEVVDFSKTSPLAFIGAAKGSLRQTGSNISRKARDTKIGQKASDFATSAGAAGVTVPRHAANQAISRFGLGQTLAATGGTGLAGGAYVNQKVRKGLVPTFKPRHIGFSGAPMPKTSGRKGFRGAADNAADRISRGGQDFSDAGQARRRPAGPGFSKSVSPMFGAKNAFADQPTRRVSALLPTGGHISHANALHVTRRGKRKSTSDSRLQRFGKAQDFGSGLPFGKRAKREDETESRVTPWARRGAVAGGAVGAGAGFAVGQQAKNSLDDYNRMMGGDMSLDVRGLRRLGTVSGGVRGVLGGGLIGAGAGALAGPRKKKREKVGKSLAFQPGMINPGTETSSWSDSAGSNLNFAATGRRGRKIS